MKLQTKRLLNKLTLKRGDDETPVIWGEDGKEIEDLFADTLADFDEFHRPGYKVTVADIELLLDFCRTVAKVCRGLKIG